MLAGKYRYKAFHEAILGDVLSVDETAELKTAAKEGTTAILLTEWASSHSDADFKQICSDTLILMGVEVE